MEVFPAAPAPVYPMTITPVWNTLISTYDNVKSASEQRRQGALFPLYDATVFYDALEISEIGILWAFYMARRGALGAFLLYDLYVMAHAGQYVGVGDGVTDIFDIPGKSTSSRTLYINGVSESSGFAYLTGGGDGGSDRVDFTTAPALGSIITIDFTGYLRIKCRFEEDRLDRENFTTVLFKTGLKMKGCK